MVRVLLLLLIVSIGACTHIAPIERTYHEPSREGLAEALRIVAAAPDRAKPRLDLSFEMPEFETVSRGMSLPVFWLRPDGKKPVLDDLWWSSCPEECPEPLTGQAAWLLDNVNKQTEAVAITEESLTAALLKARELGNSSVIAVDFGLPDFEQAVRPWWTTTRETYARAGDYICGFGRTYGTPECWPATEYSRIAIVSPDMEFTYLEATPENMVRIAELREANPRSRLRLESLNSFGSDGQGTFSPGVARAIDTFDDTEFCGVFGDPPGRIDEYCFAFSDLRTIQLTSRGEGEAWSLGDYAALPFRVAAGVGQAIAMGGAAGAGGGS